MYDISVILERRIGYVIDGVTKRRIESLFRRVLDMSIYDLSEKEEKRELG